jgi:diacylglycerol O-acyltransferase
MKQLSGSDTFFLLGEHGNVYKHIALLTIYDASTAPKGSVRFKDVLRHFTERLHTHPVFRRRLVTPPLGIDRPYWVEDKSIDLEFHIRHIALPKPGDWRQLMIQAARLHSRPLDRVHPLWEAYIIEGLDNIPKLPPGSFAMLLKLHHSAVDDVTGVQLTEKLHAARAEVPPAASEPAMITLEMPPVTFELLTRTLPHTFERIGQLGRLAVRTTGMAAALGKEQLEKLSGARDDTLALAPPPHTRFNNPVSANRVTEGFGMPHSRIDRVREKLPGTSAHDVVVATVGGGLRRYFAARKELRDQSLVAFMPVEMGTPGSSANTVSQPALIQVYTNIADPIERLRAVSQDSSKAPLDTESMGSALFANLLDVAPAFVSNFVVSKLVTRNYNLSLSTVAGPETPLHLAGARAMCLYSFGMPADGAGLVVSGVSYNRVTWLSMVACREMLPDPAVFLRCMQESWGELQAAADALPVPAVSPRKQGSGRRSSGATSRRTQNTGRSGNKRKAA